MDDAARLHWEKLASEVASGVEYDSPADEPEGFAMMREAWEIISATPDGDESALLAAVLYAAENMPQEDIAELLDAARAYQRIYDDASELAKDTLDDFFGEGWMTFENRMDLEGIGEDLMKSDSHSYVYIQLSKSGPYYCFKSPA